MKKYQNKYRIKSTRLPHWDYRNEAAYYITICTQDYQTAFWYNKSRFNVIIFNRQNRRQALVGNIPAF